MFTSLMPNPKGQFFDNNGRPLVNGFVYTYAAGTVVPKATYTDAAGTTPQTNPVVLNVRGEPASAIRWVGAYYIEVKDSLGNLIYSVDNFETPMTADELADDAGAGLVGFDYSDTYSLGTVGRWLQDLALGAGSNFIGFVQSLAGARVRTMLTKMRETYVALTDFSTIEADGSDQTAAIVAWLGTLDPEYDGMLRVPYGVKFNADTVYAALPKRAVLIDHAARNSWDTAGSRAKVITLGAEKGDPTAIVDLTTVLASSGHNASTGLDNRGTAGTSSANALVAAFHWFSGRLSIGQPGQRQIARWEWANLGGTSRWVWVMRKFVPWVARHWEYWYASTAYAAGATMLSSNGKTYSTAAGGVSGLVEPNHSSGTAVDGTITWQYLQTSQDTSIFLIDEDGAITTNTSPVSGFIAYLKAGADSPGSALHVIEATGLSKRAEYRLRATNGAGAVLSAVPTICAETDGSIRLRTNALLDHFTSTETGGFRLGPNGKTETVAANLDTTPSVSNCGMLVLANTGATLITTLDDGAPNQIVQLVFENANSTLVHSAGTFVLKGGINVTPTSGQTIDMYRYTRSGAWFEKTRSF